jgi:4-hydroxy 2-oxovalerate aldolase
MLDSTLTGMGRGPGNLRTEFIVGEISERAARTAYDLQKLLAFTAKTYEPLKDFYKWGENSYYYLGAQNMIHPTYIQYLTQKNDYSAEEIIEAISNLGAKNEIHFSEESLNFVIQQQNASKLYVTKESSTPFLGVSTVTILGAGDTLKDMTPGDHRQLKLMSGEKLLSLTLRPKVDRMLIDGYIILDPVKYFIDYKIVESHQSVVVTPFNLRDNAGVSTHNYTIPFTVEEDRLDVNDNGIILPFPSSLGYALMTLVASGVTQFKLAGFDGFGEGDLRQSQNQTILDLFNDRFGENHQVTFITATTYRVPN